MKSNSLFKILAAVIITMHSVNCWSQSSYAIAIHGGAGVMSRDRMSAEKEQAYLFHLGQALSLGDSILSTGGSSTEAVVAVVSYLEDCPMFNAGKGAVFTHDGRNELDASIMSGSTLMAGAVAGVTDIKNPIRAALGVMNNSEHVMLSGKGASQFAREQGLEIVKNKYFFTRERYVSLQQLKKEQRKRNANDNHGTVGCVALDKNGNLCAGTSTGGMTNKKYGRIGDSPIIGAGTYADNRTCAVSCTGHGEYFIRLGVARDVSALMDYKQLTLEKAAGKVLEKLTNAGGTGGFIAIDQKGNIIMPFNTSGMFRAYATSNGEKEIAIFDR